MSSLNVNLSEKADVFLDQLQVHRPERSRSPLNSSHGRTSEEYIGRYRLERPPLRRRTRSRAPILSPSPELAPTPQQTPEWVRNPTPFYEPSMNWYRNVRSRSLSPQSQRTKSLIEIKHQNRVAALEQAISNLHRRSAGENGNSPTDPEQVNSQASQRGRPMTPNAQTIVPQGPELERGRPRVRLPPTVYAHPHDWSRSPFRHPRPSLPPVIYPKDRDRLKLTKRAHDSDDEKCLPPRKRHAGRGGCGRGGRGRDGRGRGGRGRGGRGRGGRGRGCRPVNTSVDQGPALRGLDGPHDNSKNGQHQPAHKPERRAGQRQRQRRKRDHHAPT